MENTKALYEKIVKFLEDEMTTDDIKNMPISSSTLYKYKKSPDKIKHASFLTVMKIDEYMVAKEQQAYKQAKAKRKEIKYVGVDLGMKHFMSTSDMNMEYAQTIYNEQIETILFKFKEGYDRKNLTKEEKKAIKNKLYNRLKYNMPKINETIIKHWHKDVVLVIGKPSIRGGKMLEIFFTTVLRLLDKNSDGIFTVKTVNEHYTSVKCPKCNYGDNANRTKSNKFRCMRCGFKHKINDEVAARNILDKYLKLNNITV